MNKKYLAIILAVVSVIVVVFAKSCTPPVNGGSSNQPERRNIYVNTAIVIFGEPSSDIYTQDEGYGNIYFDSSAVFHYNLMNFQCVLKNKNWILCVDAYAMGGITQYVIYVWD